MIEKLAPRIAERLALKFGEEAAEKWVGRLIPLASSVVGGALNFPSFAPGAAASNANLRARHLAEHPLNVYTMHPK